MSIIASVAVTLAAIGGAEIPAAAAPVQVCETIDGKLKCTIVDPGDPAPPPGPGPESPYIYVYELGIGPCPEPDQTLWFISVYLRSTGELVQTLFPCLGPGDPPPPPPPPPPTEGEFAEAIEPLLGIETSLSPPADGIGGVSQLDTWFWCDNDAPVTIDLSLGGWRTTATVEIATLTWTVTGPDGTIEVAADDCGSEPASDSNGETAAAMWTPNLPGDYQIVLEIEWSGSWTRSIGGASETFPLSDVTVTNAPVDYSVVEIQTVGRDN